MKIKKGDTVKIITGNEAGKSGRVIKVFPSLEKIVVEGVNLVKKHSRPSQENPQGGIIEKESSVHVSNVMSLTGDVPSRLGYKFLDDGKKVKFSKKNGDIIK
tara:strand:+ start:284 stop:589 length:306 start_codon:yes stop_codon:yes gene_type:complete